MKRRSLLPLLALAGLGLVACSDDSGSSSATTAAPAETTAAPSTGAAATVEVAALGDSGEGLVDADGFTLYLFEQDDGTTSACTGGCADIWPALTADGEAVGGDGVDASLLGTADGQVPDQVTYNGHLLYTFSGDEAPGDVNGVQIPDWYPVDPSGEAIDEG